MKSYSINIWQFIANNIAGNVLCPNVLRSIIYNLIGIKTKTKRFNSNVWFYGNKIVFEEGVFVNNRVFFHNYDKIIIEKNVFIGPEAMLTTGLS
jgi:acetyltransferase-like isoleucine patch superfamily enzyme